jgi:hypothetical protein
MGRRLRSAGVFTNNATDTRRRGSHWALEVAQSRSLYRPGCSSAPRISEKGAASAGPALAVACCRPIDRSSSQPVNRQAAELNVFGLTVLPSRSSS